MSDLTVGDSGERARKVQVKPEEVPHAKAVFLEQLRGGWSISRAARIASIDRDTAYRWRNTDLQFRRDWDSAREAGWDSVEDDLRVMARGTLRPIYQGGKRVGHEKQRSSDAAKFLLEGNRKGTYRRTLDITHGGRLDLNGMDDAALNGRLEGILRAKLEPLFLRVAAPTLEEILGCFRISELPSHDGQKALPAPIEGEFRELNSP